MLTEPALVASTTISPPPHPVMITSVSYNIIEYIVYKVYVHDHALSSPHMLRPGTSPYLISS